ncbi:MAG: hypothetical protein GWP14_03380 [Actinobacteria bacterium]|nr:hypothetical protein [Actinomycetota bacterium]
MSGLSQDKLVRDYADGICLYSKAGLECIKNLITGLSKHRHDDSLQSELKTFQSFEVLLEFVYILLHLTSRWMYGTLEVNKAQTIFDTLSSKCINATVDYGLFGFKQNIKAEIRQKAFENFREVNHIYSKYIKLIPEGDGGAKDTLFLEFGKNIASLAGIKNVIACNGACLNLITRSLQKMNPGQFTEDLQE